MVVGSSIAFYEELMSEMIRSLREVERTENVCEDMLSVDEFLESIHKELFTEWADNIPVSDAKYKSAAALCE